MSQYVARFRDMKMEDEHEDLTTQEMAEQVEVLPHGMYCVNPFDRVELPLPLPERAATPKKHRLSYDELHDTMIHAAIE